MSEERALKKVRKLEKRIELLELKLREVYLERTLLMQTVTPTVPIRRTEPEVVTPTQEDDPYITPTTVVYDYGWGRF